MVKATVEAQLRCPRCGADPTQAQIRTFGGTIACDSCGKPSYFANWIRPERIVMAIQ